MAELLGHDVDSNGVMVRNSNDVAPYVGFGRVVTKMINGAYRYKVEALLKTKFAEPSQDDTTKGESLEFSTSELEGVVSTLANGDWSKTKTFTSKSEAIAYLEGILGGAISAQTATVTYNAGSGTGTIESVTVPVGTAIQLNDGSGLTPPSNKHFAGWDTTSSATTPDLTGTYVVTGDVTLYAIYEANA